MHGLILDIKQFIVGQRTRITNNRQVFRSVVALFSGNMAASLLCALGGLLVARFLGPEVTGRFRVFTIPLTYLVVLHIGTFDGLHREIPYYSGKMMPGKVDELASSSGAWNILISIVVSLGFVICAVYSLWRHDFYGVAGWLSQAFFCWGIFYNGYLGATYRTINQFVSMARIQLAQSVLTFGLVLLVPFFKFYGLCIRTAIPAVLGVWLYHRNRPLKMPYRLDWMALRDVVKVGLPFSFWGSLDSSVWLATESALMLSLGGITALGLFSVAAVMREGMSILPQAINQVMAPRVVESYAKEGSIRTANARSLLLTGILTVGTAVMVLMI